MELLRRSRSFGSCRVHKTMHVRIVLVEPRDAGNVGAAARAMKNFGFTDLWIAGGGAERTDNVSAWWAVGANDVVQSATRVGTLAEALVDCHLAVATTAGRGKRAGAASAHPTTQYARPRALRGNRLVRRQESGPHVRGAAGARGTGRADDARGLATLVVAPPHRALAREAVTLPAGRCRG